MIERLGAEVGDSHDDSSAVDPAVSSPPKTVPYHKRLLLKSLLRAIALASYSHTTGARPAVRLIILFFHFMYLCMYFRCEVVLKYTYSVFYLDWMFQV